MLYRKERKIRWRIRIIMDESDKGDKEVLWEVINMKSERIDKRGDGREKRGL